LISFVSLRSRLGLELSILALYLSFAQIAWAHGIGDEAGKYMGYAFPSIVVGAFVGSILGRKNPREGHEGHIFICQQIFRDYPTLPIVPDPPNTIPHSAKHILLRSLLCYGGQVAPAYANLLRQVTIKHPLS
jgi:hypothetical protein